MAVPRRSIREIDSITAQCHLFLSLSHPSHPFRPACVYGIAMGRLDRYELSNEEEPDTSDLDNLKEILHLAESMLRHWQPRSLPEPKHIIHFFSVLFLALHKRSEKRPKHATYAAKFLRHLRNQPHAASGFSRHVVTTSLVNVLVIQVVSETSNVLQNIEEMAVICHELLLTDPSDDDITASIILLSNIVSSKIHPLVPDQPLDQVIECLRLARIHKPELRRAHFALALCLRARYLTTLVNDDYEEITSILDEIITSSPSGDSQDEDMVTEARGLVTALALFRSSAHNSPEYAEEAIYRAHSSRTSFPVGHPLSSSISKLEDHAKQRFSNFDSTEVLEASSSYSPLSRPEPVTFHNPEFVRMYKKGELLEELLSGIRNGDVMEIEEAVENGRSILASFSSTHPLASTLFELFGRVLDEAFKRTQKIQYLNESISTRRQVLGRPSQPSQHGRFSTLFELSMSLLKRVLVTSSPNHQIRDIEEVLELLSLCANDETAILPDRCQCASLWAYFARVSRHPSVSTAYENAMSLTQDALHFAPTLQLQRAAFSETPTFSSVVLNSIPLDYASYQVGLHQVGKAIETLERGRALLWSEMRRLRTSIDQLLQVEPELGNSFSAVNRDLEELTKSIPPSRSLNIDDGGADNLRAVDPFGRLLVKQRGLMKKRNDLISQIRTLPGFGGFLTSPSFDTLRSAASAGPVIIINHAVWRSDILILLHNASPSLISTRRDFYNRTNALKDRLSESRNQYGLDSSDYDKTLASVLVELYNLVGKPVINRLRQLKVPEQSRIWWCPTSVFCSLPLHAMGPIPSDDGEVRYFSDLYICSYTPTLSALIQSRNRDYGSRSSDRPSILLVAQPDPSLPTVEGEIQVVQRLDTNVTSLISEAATPTATIDGFQHHPFVHVACHGTLEARKPFDAGFELYGNERLTLLEIIRSHLPIAEFAFLSACHTAEATEGCVKDEVLHLVAAVQFCGFRSVVGTMWAMADIDGQDLAKHFYKSMFPKREKGERVPYYKRSAGALHDAVKELRRKRGVTLERWVNFVHYGA